MDSDQAKAEKEAQVKFDKAKADKIKKYLKKIKDLEGDLETKSKKWDAEVGVMEEGAVSAEKELAGVLEQIAEEEAKMDSVPSLSDKDKKKLEQSTALMDYLKKENKRVRTNTIQLGKDMETEQDQHKVLLEASMQCAIQAGSNNSANNEKQVASMDKFAEQNKVLVADMRMRQAYYDAEAETRMFYQKGMSRIMKMIQDNCDDAQLTEDILFLALECESEAKVAAAVC
jgi:hypothetical protein